MDKVYILWRIERYEAKNILGVFKTKERACEWAQAYMKESVYDWEPDDWGREDAWWCGAMDLDLRIMVEDVLP